MRLSDLRYSIIYFLCLLMPWHVLIFNIIDISFITLWRDILLVVLLFLTRLKRNSFVFGMIFRTVVCIVYAFLFHDSNMAPSTWINVLRVYIMPSVVGFILFNSSQFTYNQLIKICRLYILNAIIINLFGLFQLLFWGDAYLKIIGVEQFSVLLADGTQRNIGVFESANVMGIYLLIALLLSIQVKNVFKKKKYMIIVACFFLVGIIFTYSMSTFLALAVIGILKTKDLKFDRVKKEKLLKISLLFLLFIIISIILIVSEPIVLFVLRKQLSEKIIDIVTTLNGTNRIATSSAAIHYNDFFDGLRLALNNINGLGFAKESFMVMDKVTNRNLIGIRESSYLTIMYDFGILVGIIYIIPYSWGLMLSKYRERHNSLVSFSNYLSVLFLVAYIFLPLIQSYELNFFFFLFLGAFYSYLKSN